MILPGTKVRFDPFGYLTGEGADMLKGNFVTGVVDMVNEPHQWFSVKYGENQRTSFKFCEIGQAVNVIG